VKRAKSDWSGALLVCAKCSKKVGGGFGPKGRDRLAKALRHEPGFGKGRKAAIGVIEVKCLGLCPKGAVTVVDTRRPGEWLVVPAGSDVAELAGQFS
jgi:predicted metal-binding protein